MDLGIQKGSGGVMTCDCFEVSTFKGLKRHSVAKHEARSSDQVLCQ